MSFSSGAYFGNHSMVSQGRIASAARLAYLCGSGRCRAPARLGASCVQAWVRNGGQASPAERRIAAALAPADMHDQFAGPWSSTPTSARLHV